MRRFISFTLLLCLLASLLAIPVSAEEEMFDLAQGRRVEATGYVGDHTPDKAVDGWYEDQADSWIVGGHNAEDYENRFAEGNLELDSVPIDRDVWIRIDLGTRAAFDRMQFVERAAGNPRGRAAGWVIEISDDDQNWTEVISGNWLTHGPGSNDPHDVAPYDVDFDRVEARFVRVRFTAAAHVNIGFFRISVFNRSGILAEGEEEFRAAEAEAEAIRQAEREAAAAERAAAAEAAAAEREAAEAAAAAEAEAAEAEAGEDEETGGAGDDETPAAPAATPSDDGDGINPIVIVLIIVGVVVVAVVVVIVIKKGKGNTEGSASE